MQAHPEECASIFCGEPWAASSTAFPGEKQTCDKNQAKEQREWKKGGLARMVGKKVEETFDEWKVKTTMLGRTEPQPPLDVEQPDHWRVAFVAEAGTRSVVSRLPTSDHYRWPCASLSVTIVGKTPGCASCFPLLWLPLLNPHPGLLRGFWASDCPSSMASGLASSFTHGCVCKKLTHIRQGCWSGEYDRVAVLRFQNYENLADVVIIHMLKIPSILRHIR
jgi:hypothetical protein